MTTAIGIGKVITNFEDYIRQNGGVCGNWYVGVAADARDRLFNEHNVLEKGGAWTYQDCGTDTVARQVENHFLRLGCQGGPGGGDHRSKYVYAYKITPTTVE